MVGRAVELTVHKEPRRARRGRARRRGPLGRRRRSARSSSTTSSFEVRAGEILAIAGVQGNGQTELTEAILGLQPRVQGRDHPRRQATSRATASARCSTPASASCPRTATKTASSASSPSPRTSCSTASTAGPFVKRGSLQLGDLAAFADEKVEEFDVRTPGHHDAGRPPLGRQPAEGRARPRAQPRPAAVRRGPAHPRHRRRLDRVRAQAHRRDPRRGRARHRRLDRARRGRRARRPHRGHVPRRDRRHRARRHPARRARPHDGRRGPAAGERSTRHERRRPPTRRSPGAAGAGARRAACPEAEPTRAGSSGSCARSRRASGVISILAVVLALVVRRHPDRLHRPRRAGDRGLLLRPARRLLPGDLGRRSAVAYSSLFQGAVYNFSRRRLRRRHPPADRDAQLRRPR